jgi:hypothetical protein
MFILTQKRRTSENIVILVWTLSSEEEEGEAKFESQCDWREVFFITEETEIKRNNGKEYLYNFELNYV